MDVAFHLSTDGCAEQISYNQINARNRLQIRSDPGYHVMKAYLADRCN